MFDSIQWYVLCMLVLSCAGSSPTESSAACLLMLPWYSAVAAMQRQWHLDTPLHRYLQLGQCLSSLRAHAPFRLHACIAVLVLVACWPCRSPRCHSFKRSWMWCKCAHACSCHGSCFPRGTPANLRAFLCASGSDSAFYARMGCSFLLGLRGAVHKEALTC
jgi:hypothetical protein